MTPRWRWLAPVLFLGTGACAATSADVDSLRSSVNLLRAEQVHAESLHTAQVARAQAEVAALSDSVVALSARVAKMSGDVRGDLYAISQQLISVQELTGQSQRRLQDLRASLEQRQAELAPAPAGGAGAAAAGGAAGAAAGGATPAPGTPGPNELFQLSLQQLSRGSYGAARTGLNTLLQQYPQSDLVPDAMFYIGETWAKEGNAGAADSAFASVVAKYPKSARAPTALYKRAASMEARNNLTGARAAYTQLVQQYPRSDEAALARERLRALQ
jgi:tol-pal system protein YbgF